MILRCFTVLFDNQIMKGKNDMSNEFDDIRVPWGKIIAVCLLVVVLGMGLSWVIQGNDFFMYKFFAPKQEAVRRQVFEQTPSYVKGMVQELQNMQFDYVKEKNPEAKTALASIILHRASGFNLNDPDVPADLRAFISKLKQEQIEAR
jgi:hypothetical protein